MANIHGQRTYDAALVLKAAGLIAATANGALILDLGPGLIRGDLVMDVTAVEIATGDEIYTVSVECSNDATMASGSVCVARKVFGNLVAPMDAALSAAGRYVMPVRNEEAGDVYRYMRLQITVAGTVATGINFSAFLAIPGA